MSHAALFSSHAHFALDALGDRTRRSILAELAGGPRPVNEIAAALPVTRSAVSQHLRVLAEAGLVSSVRAGTRRVYALDPGGLDAAAAWLRSLGLQARPNAQAERSSAT